MLAVAIFLLCLGAAVGVYLAVRKRAKFNAEQTARLRARRRWSQWLDGKGPEPPHDESYVEYQERKRRSERS